eukprot:760652-Rhodomonas_salina.1
MFRDFSSYQKRLPYAPYAPSVPRHTRHTLRQYRAIRPIRAIRSVSPAPYAPYAPYAPSVSRRYPIPLRHRYALSPYAADKLRVVMRAPAPQGGRGGRGARARYPAAQCTDKCSIHMHEHARYPAARRTLGHVSHIRGHVTSGSERHVTHLIFGHVTASLGT